MTSFTQRAWRHWRYVLVSTAIAITTFSVFSLRLPRTRWVWVTLQASTRTDDGLTGLSISTWLTLIEMRPHIRTVHEFSPADGSLNNTPGVSCLDNSSDQGRENSSVPNTTTSTLRSKILCASQCTTLPLPATIWRYRHNTTVYFSGPFQILESLSPRGCRSRNSSRGHPLQQETTVPLYCDSPQREGGGTLSYML